MGGGGFGGDASVDWDIHGDNVRKHDSKPPGGGKFRQQTGTDETPEGPVQYFTVAIKLPKNPGERTLFVDSLQRELNNNNGSITVKVPIEDVDHGGPTLNQITVDWPSRPTGNPSRATRSARVRQDSQA